MLKPKTLERCISLLLIFPIFFSGCKNESNGNDNLFNSINKRLQHSNKIISNSTATIYRKMETQLAEPQTHAILSIWHPKAKMVKEKATELYQYLNSIKAKVSAEGFTNLSKATSDNLFNKIDSLARHWLKIDERFEVVFAADSSSTILHTLINVINNKEFYDLYFSSFNTIKTKTSLYILENSIVNAENRLINYCSSQYCIIPVRYDSDQNANKAQY